MRGAQLITETIDVPRMQKRTTAALRALGYTPRRVGDTRQRVWEGDRLMSSAERKIMFRQVFSSQSGGEIFEGVVNASN